MIMTNIQTFFGIYVEDACLVWHTSLDVADSAKIESIQRRGMRIIITVTELCYDADAACSEHHLEKTVIFNYQ